MDQSDSQHNLRPEDTNDASSGVSSSLELGKVKHVLSVKMEKPDAHYTTIQPLGKGSFGEVHTALDTLLGREVAIKSLKSQFREEEEVVDRFLKEARGTSQLEHPNIMPVHEMGVTDELGIYFTMKKIEGEDLKEILDRLEANTSFYIKKYPLSRLLEIFLSVCNGIAFAHSKGVIHRDLKPANIMIGEFGEVLILDWGLVKRLDTDEGTRGGVQLRMEEFDVGSNTLDGAISGTPNYMSPEQAEGDIDAIDFQSDIYSLGSILYHMLTYLPPFEKTQLRKLLENVKKGDFQPPRKRRPEARVPRELEAICLKAMARYQVNRYRSVEKLAEDVRNYIGHHDVSAYKAPLRVRLWKTCRRNPIKSSVAAAVVIAVGLVASVQRAMLYDSYKRNLERAEHFRAEADALVDEANAVHLGLQASYASNHLKRLTVDEIKLENELTGLVADIDKQFNLAIGYYDGIPPQYQNKAAVHQGYADAYSKQIEFGLLRQRYDRAQQWLDTVKERFDKGGLGPEARAYIAETEKRIKGDARLTITAADGARAVELLPIVTAGFRLKEGDPLYRSSEFPYTVPNELAKGSYLLAVTLENGKKLPYPIYIHHGRDLEIALDPPGAIPEGMVFVPEGPFISGGEASRFFREREISLPSFFIKKHEVTVGEYLEFWKTLDDARKSDYMSRVRFRQRDRKYADAWDATGLKLDERIKPEHPVVGLTMEAVEAFCAWESERRGMIARLPTAEEWEKAARGVDGRVYVWGDTYDEDANITLTKYNEEGKKRFPIWAPPGSFRYDNSIYNVADMAGNAREMTSSRLPDSEEFYQLKGGSASTPPNFLPCANSSDTAVVPSDVGFRYVIEKPSDS